MFASSIPLLVIRTDSPALVSVNGQMLGECSGGGYVAMPVSETGDYYVFVQPLCPRHYALTRKFSFVEGRLLLPLAEDLSLCSWPGGVYACTIRIPKEPRIVSSGFGSILDRGNFLGCACVLCKEERIRLELEQRGELIFGYCLGDGESGSLGLWKDCLAVQIYGEEKTRLLLLDPKLRWVLDTEGERIRIEEDSIAVLTDLPTHRGHEKRRLYRREQGSMLPPKEEIGFFSRAPKPLSSDLGRALAFFEAVREGLSEEAMEGLSEELRASADLKALRDFLGEYERAEAPLSDASGRLMGLIREQEPGIFRADLYELRFQNGKIDNIAEV